MRIYGLICLAGIFVLSGCSVRNNVGVRTEALDDSAWNSSVWISAADAPVVSGRVDSRRNHRAADGASWFLTRVENPGKVVSARWMTAGLGVYELYLNGVQVGEDMLKPGFTHPHKTKRSFTYDITDAFKCAPGAENVLSSQVLPGWWADRIVTLNGQEGMTGKKCAFRAVLELTLEDGGTLLYGTDTSSWVSGIAGPVKHAGIFDGEQYDARVRPGYMTPELLGTPELNEEFSGEILPTCGAEICFRRDLALKPVEAYVWEGTDSVADGRYGRVVRLRDYKEGQTMRLRVGESLVVDFGQNAAAVPSFEFKAAEGTVLTCLPGEILNDGNGEESRGMDGPGGSVHRRNLRFQDDCFRIDYTFAGNGGYERYEPHFSFFGYRFVSITATGEVKIRRIRSVPVSSISEEMETGSISTGNPLINKLLSNTVWGQRSNYLSVPTDCPQRNERLGWTADTQVFTLTGSYFANTDAFFHKWLRDLRDCQSSTGAFPGVAPPGLYGSNSDNYMRLGWADAGIIVPWTIWRQFGDNAVIEESWESMEFYMRHVNESRYDNEAIKAENGNYQWADWLSYEPLESCGRSAFTPKDSHGRRYPIPDAVEYWNYLGACYWALDADMMKDMAYASGRDTSVYGAMAASARDYIKGRFLDNNGLFRTQILNTMQTPALFALKTGVVRAEAREAMIQRLRENFSAHGGCLQTGFLGTSILMQTLTDNGLADIAYDLLFQRRNPSWLYSVDNGATTIWERWNSYTIENGMGPNGMNSFNHYAYGCVCAWIWETVAGIAADASSPGFRHIIMKPVPDRRLGSVDAVYRSAGGVIKSSWKYSGDVCEWHFTIPEGATASVTLPGETEAIEYTAGSYTLTL